MYMNSLWGGIIRCADSTTLYFISNINTIEKRGRPLGSRRTRAKSDNEAFRGTIVKSLNGLISVVQRTHNMLYLHVIYRRYSIPKYAW